MIRPTVLLDELSSDLNEEVGSKFATLGDIRNFLGFSPPDGFVTTIKAFFDFMRRIRPLTGVCDECSRGVGQHYEQNADPHP